MNNLGSARLDEQQYHTIKNWLEDRPTGSCYARMMSFILDNPFCSADDISENCDLYAPQHINNCSRKIAEACFPCRLVTLIFHHPGGQKTARYAILNWSQ